MIERVIEFSIRNRFLVLAITIALTLVAIYATWQTPVDAIPDLSENQVIVFADWMGRSPREIEDQVTYPLSRKLQGLAGIKAVRSSSEFNFSMITLIFEEDVDFYFARTRVTEKLAQANTFLPAGVTPYLAPDATALGQVFWYTVEPDKQHPIDAGKLWALNKFYITPQLNSAAGVADVAVVGGMPLEYQIDVRPEDLRSYNVTLGDLYSAVARSNMPSGGGVIQKNNAEFIVRGIGWIQGKEDIENTVITEIGGTPIYVKNVASVQLGTQFRRSVYEKDGNEVTGGVVLMRHGGNPLEVTQRVKEKIQELQSGLPQGVHIIPAYDRTRLIQGAIHTLTEVMWHEMLIASLAILLILMHVRSVFVICVTLPLAVLFSFLLMWLLRVLHIIDIQANIMSLAGITISIGILVDQAIVMVENATHHLKAHFGDQKVTGDTRELVIPPCRTVGRPIFFSVLIMLLSFIPVFMLSGREGKLFHPLAFTKSFAMIGVAIISVTVVPALIPTFIRGRLKSEEDNWIVRSFIQIYKPLLTWALPRRNLVMWLFSALLIFAAGIFPIQSLIGMGASSQFPQPAGSMAEHLHGLLQLVRGNAPGDVAWKWCFLLVFGLVTFVTVLTTRKWYWQLTSLVTLLLVGAIAYHIQPKIGVTFMPALDEGTTLDMPITVPRASVTQAADDLKARDALLRGFPEVESVIGKAGRADTPTDPAPLDMVETFVNYRPRELWPKRVLRYDDAARQTGDVLEALIRDGFILEPKSKEDRKTLIIDATQKGIERFDEALRELALTRYTEFERELGAKLVEHDVQWVLSQLERQGDLHWPVGEDAQAIQGAIRNQLTKDLGFWLARAPAPEDASQLVRGVVQMLYEHGAVKDVAQAMELKESTPATVAHEIGGILGAERPTLASQLLAETERERTRLWRDLVRQSDWELFDRGTESFTWYALEEVSRAAASQSLLDRAPRRKETESFLAAALRVQLGKEPPARIAADSSTFAPFQTLREELEQPFRRRVFFWQRKAGPKGDLVDDEMGRVLQVPGWSNIFTQPIINRIDMLSTGVRTDIGVKVFGPDLETIDHVCKEVEQTLKPIRGARGTIAAPVMGKGYLQIDIDREAAARYGISVADIQDVIEVALAGKAITYTVEKRDRFPVRIRYARVNREDEESIRRLLVSPGTMTASPSMTEAEAAHPTTPPHAQRGKRFIPLSALAKIHVVEGPAMIKSENGSLLSYVTLNVRGRDMVGFVDEAQRVVAQKVRLPEGVHIEWSGEFEHQVRAARTLRFVFPAVILLIFLILYLTYHDLADATLMMLAVPEALAGGAFFMYLFPKITQGWETPPMDFSVAVWVGFIACFGMATETGIIMLVYLREAIDKRGGLENIGSLEELRQAVIEGAVHRLRPKLLTEGVAIIAIFPMVFASGVGGEILAPMALPVLGGLLISDEVVDLFLPVRFYWVRRARWLALQRQRQEG